VVLATAIVGLVATIPGQTMGVSVVLDRIIEDLGLSRSSVSGAYTLGTLGGAAVMPFFGRWLDVHGPRRAGSVVVLLFGLACLLTSTVHSWLWLLGAFTLLRALGQGALSMISTQAVNLWFLARRGMALGIAGVGMAAGNALVPLGMERLSAVTNWRTTYQVCGVVLLVLVLPLVGSFLRRHPEAFGLHPEGASVPAESSGKGPQMYLREARRTGVFWAILLSGALTSTFGTALIFHNFAIVGQHGLDRAAAALVFAPLAVVAAITNLGTGIAADRTPPARLIPLSMLVMAGASVMALFAGSGPMVLVYGGLIGAAMGIQGSIGSVAYAHYFGTKHLGEIKGLTFMVGVAGSAVGPSIFALLYDGTGSYVVPAALSAALACVVGFASVLLQRGR
jgi:MFS transporter, OFA family, oxalate/formate antiporter